MMYTPLAKYHHELLQRPYPHRWTTRLLFWLSRWW